MRNNLTFNSVVLMVANSMKLVSALIISIVLSRYLNVSDYGTYQQLFMVHGIVLAIISFGLPSSINFFLPRTKSNSERKGFVVQTYFILLAIGVFFGALVTIFAGYISRGLNNPGMAALLRVFIIYTLFLTPIVFIDSLLIVLKKTFRLVVYKTILFVFGLGAVLLPIAFGASLDTIILSLVIFSVVQFLVASFLIFQPFIGVKILWKWTYLTSQLGYSFYLGLATIVGMLTTQLDKLSISLFFRPDQFSIYSVGAVEIPVIGLLTGAVTAIILPEFAKLHKEKNTKKLISLWHNSIRKTAVLLLPMMCFLLLFAEEALVLIFSKKYIASANIFRIYLILIPARVTVFGSVLMAINKTKVILTNSVLALILDFVLNIIFIKWLGLIGPAITTIISIYWLQLYQLKKIGESLKLPFRTIFPWSMLTKIILASALPLCLTFWLKFVELSIVLKLLIGGMIYGGVYFLIALKQKIISKQDWIFFKNIR